MLHSPVVAHIYPSVMKISINNVLIVLEETTIVNLYNIRRMKFYCKAAANLQCITYGLYGASIKV